MDFGNKLKTLRKQNGMTQAELAEKLGVSVRTIQHYELGRQYPKNSQVFGKAAELFGVPAGCFLSDDEAVAEDREDAKKPHILTFDIGTSSCKSVLFSEDGTILAMGRGSYPLYYPREGWVEQKPAELLDGIRAAMESLSAAAGDMRSVKAISFCSQMAAQCLVDEEGTPLTNIMSWMDQRAVAELEEYNARFSREDTARLTDMDMVITPSHTVAKLRWMKKNIPDTLAKAKYMVQVKELVIHYLTGNWVSDQTSLKSVVGQYSGRPIKEIFDFIGISPSILPEVKQPYEIAGRLKRGVSGFERLTAGIPVVVGWNDMNAAYLGMAGLPENVVGLDLSGTSEHVGLVRTKDGKPFSYEGVNRIPFLNDKEVFYGVTSAAGQAASWFVEKFIRGQSNAEKYDRFFELVSDVRPIEIQKLLFLPYLEGERHPWCDPAARGVFFGITSTHGTAQFGRAVLEGICFELRAIFECLPVKPEYMIVAGGSSKSELWNQMKADIFGVPFYRLSTTEAGCQGAEMLANMALGTWDRFSRRQGGPSAIEKIYTPDMSLKEYYDRKFSEFVRLYKTVRNLF